MTFLNTGHRAFKMATAVQLHNMNNMNMNNI